MKKKYFILIISVIAVFLFLGIYFARSISFSKDVVIPENIQQVENFVKKQDSYILNENVENYVKEMSIEGYEEICVATIYVNDKNVELFAIKFEDKDDGMNYIKNFDSKKIGHLRIGQLQYNFPEYSYYTVTSNGKKFYLWFKENWIVEVNGTNTQAVRQIKEDLEEYILNPDHS